MANNRSHSFGIMFLLHRYAVSVSLLVSVLIGFVVFVSGLRVEHVINSFIFSAGLR